MILIDLLLLLLALVLAVPCMVLLVECLAAPVDTNDPPPMTSQPRPTVAVLVPAHDQEAGIEATVTALRAQLAADDQLLVVADNCSDRTAELATAAGATVVERHDAGRRGEGYALSFGLAALANNPPEVVLVVDADCRIAEGGLERLARRAIETSRPVQAEYLLRPPSSPDASTALSSLALIVRNQVRPRGLLRLGVPCPLMGSGMAFPWPLLRDVWAREGLLIEEMVLGVDLAIRGTPPVPCPSVSAWGAWPSSGAAQQLQHQRWEHGHLSTLWTHGPRLLLAGLARFDLFAMALDLLVPPLALLVLLLGGAMALALLGCAMGGSWAPLILVLASIASVIVSVTSAWRRFGRATIPGATFLLVPLYLAWKIPLYAAFLFRHRQPRGAQPPPTGEQPPPTGEQPPPTGT